MSDVNHVTCHVTCHVTFHVTCHVTCHLMAMDSKFLAVKERYQVMPTSLKSTLFTFGFKNFGINLWCEESLNNIFGYDGVNNVDLIMD